MLLAFTLMNNEVVTGLGLGLASLLIGVQASLAFVLFKDLRIACFRNVARWNTRAGHDRQIKSVEVAQS